MASRDGKIESGRRGVIQKLILESVATAGVLSIALVAPNVLGAMEKAGISPLRRQKEMINAARTKLLRNGLLTRDKNGNLLITKKGKTKLMLQGSLKTNRKRKQRWDGKWRVLIFDIPEYRRAVRLRLRRSLQEAGFAYLQDSVWIYPYPCEEFVALLKTDFKIGKQMLYLVVEAIEEDHLIRKKFSL